MTKHSTDKNVHVDRLDSGLRSICGIAAYFQIAADPEHLQRELALGDGAATDRDLLLAARMIGLKARLVRNVLPERLRSVPAPAIMRRRDGAFVVFGGMTPAGSYRIVDPITSLDRHLSVGELSSELEPEVILVARRIIGEGVEPKFGFRWFLPSIWRYRKPLAHVALASFFVQVFALVTPLFFQVVVDKVLTHKGYETLVALVAGLALIGLFDVVLQYLRTYALSHTTNRIDVELGRRLFRHLLRLPLGYFETRSAGQTVARMRELENIRNFLTGQGMFSVIDLVFTILFIAVLFAYSWKLSLIVVGAIPFYLAIAIVIRPPLRETVREKFNRGAASQQFLVEAVVGIQTIKTSAVEPVMQLQWEERLAAYVRTTFSATLMSAVGQNATQYVGKLGAALLLLFGAKAVIDGELTVGALVAFNMIAGQVTQPVLRLSQLWQDFQQVQVSVERLGDLMDAPSERSAAVARPLPPPKGALSMRNIAFRYGPKTPYALRDVSISIRAGEVVGIVGPSGSGKSTLTKLIQRLYVPEQGQVILDGIDLAHADTAWLRRHIGVVLQENLLFNRTIHENIAFANPAMLRAQVMAIAKLAGADEFIARLPMGYDTMVEERGANLSGGQRQRIAIARALATNPPILIFDEATSALDYESERIIQDNMRQIVRGRTVIIIAHRLAAVRPCDRIIGMIDGRIVEAGSHDELLRRPGRTLFEIMGDTERAGGMNAIVKTHLPQVIARPPRMLRADQEFLPAALEILETPPSPIKMALILTICSFIVISLGWAYNGRVDIIAVAQGKMQPAGRVKVIQPLDNGKVSAIPVVNGQSVRAGDFLVELDSAEVRADEIGLANDYASLLAEIVRRRAVAAAVQTRVLSPPPTIAWGSNIAFSMRERENGVMTADLAKLDASLAGLSAQREQKKAEFDRLTKTVAIQKELVGTLQERVDMRTTLVKASAGTKASVIDATEVLQNQRTSLASQEGQLAETAAGLDVLAREAETALTTFASDNAQKLADAQRQADEAEQKLVKAQARTQHMTLVSPIAGTVQASNVTTIGQVVTTGQEIMRVVPNGPTLEIEAYLANKDVGFVRVGQEAIVKIDAFPFTRYGTLKATITRIAQDAIPEPEAEQTEGESTRGSASNLFAGAQRVQNLVFPVTLTPETTVMKADGRPIALLPGMAATVEIKTGRRRILEYLFSPMVEIASNALKER